MPAPLIIPAVLGAARVAAPLLSRVIGGAAMRSAGTTAVRAAGTQTAKTATAGGWKNAISNIVDGANIASMMPSSGSTNHYEQAAQQLGFK